MNPCRDLLGAALAMRVLQSDLYHDLDSIERAECDELIRRQQAVNASADDGAAIIARALTDPQPCHSEGSGPTPTPRRGCSPQARLLCDHPECDRRCRDE